MSAVHNLDLKRLLAGLDDGTYGLDSSAMDWSSTAQAPKTEATLNISTHAQRTPFNQNPTIAAVAGYKHPRSWDTTEASAYTPDASTITTWPAALKYLTKYIFTNENVCNRIRNLILEQHKHEKQWWTQRQDLVAQQQSREGTQAQAVDFLKSLGIVSVPTRPVSAEENEAELKTFDSKVYKSLLQMTSHFEAKLRALNVPFFATKDTLVADEQLQGYEAAVLSKTALRSLQRRMLQTLEDLLVGD